MQNKLQKPKFKHNKKRNTAFLFEALVKELTKAALYGDKNKQRSISGIIREHFNKNSVLHKELSLYKQIYETNNFPKDVAEKFINTLKNDHEKINENDIYNEQSKLIAKINKNIGFQFYDNFVPNYKTLATISQIFNRNVEAKQKVLLEQELINNITGKLLIESNTVKTVDNSVMARFVERFNETYNEALLEEQKNLLSKYINSDEEHLELKLYLNEELARLKNILAKIESNDTVKQVSESLEQLRINEISDDLIKKIMYVQQFAHEVSN